MNLLDEMAVVDGVRLAYRSRGLGEPVVFLHGTPSHSFIWRKVLPSVEEEGYRVVAYDLLGSRILWGAEDQWQPASYGRRLAGDISTAELTIVPEAGHFLMEDTTIVSWPRSSTSSPKLPPTSDPERPRRRELRGVLRCSSAKPAR